MEEDDKDEDFDFPVEKVEIVLDSVIQIQKFLSQISMFQTMENEILSDFDQEEVWEDFSMISPVIELKKVFQ